MPTLGPRLGKIALVDLKTHQVTEALDSFAQRKFGTRTLSHIKWMLNGVYEHAISKGVVKENPVIKSKWLTKAKKPQQKTEYSLSQVLEMLRVLEPVDIPVCCCCRHLLFHLKPAIRVPWHPLGGLARR
jgi:hypothetical protein